MEGQGIKSHILYEPPYCPSDDEKLNWIQIKLKYMSPGKTMSALLKVR